MESNLLFILDDDVFYSQLIFAHLGKYKLEVEMYYNSSTCLKNLFRKPFLILLDYNLNEADTGITGKEIFREIKREYPETAIAIISNQDSGQVVLELIQTGVRHYVEKDEYFFANLDKIIETQMAMIDPKGKENF